MLLFYLTIIFYTTRVFLIGIAIGTFFIRFNLFNKFSDGHTMVLGIASTPMFLSMIDYFLGLFFVGWVNMFYTLVPMSLAIIYLAINNRYIHASIALNEIRGFVITVYKRVGLWALFDMLVAFCVILVFSLIYNGFQVKTIIESFFLLDYIGRFLCAIVIGVAIVSIGILLYKIYKSNYLTDNLYLIIIIIVFGTAIAHACSMNDRALVDEDRSHYELDARYFLEDKNSWEIDDYSDEKYGSSLTDDHGPLWVVFLADTYIVANSFNIDNPIRCTNYAILWVYLCFYLLLFIIGTYVGSTYRTGIMALVFFNIYVYSVYEITGSRDAYRLVGLLLLLIYVINQIDNVSDGDAKWFEYLMLGLFCYLSMNGHEGNVYIMLGMFIVVSLILVIQQTPIKHFIAFISVVFVGTVLGITKTIKIYIRTGSLKSSTNIPFHDTPVIEQIASINIKRSDLQTIWMSYTLQVKWMILLGLIGLIMMIVVSFKKKR